MRRWGALLAISLLAARASATPAAFAEANDFWPAGTLPNLNLGTLLHVDRVNVAPSRVRVICPASHMGITTQAVSRALFSSQYRVGAGESPVDELGQFLNVVNVINEDEVLISLSLGVDNVEVFSLPGNELPEDLGMVSRDCLNNIAQVLERHSPSRSNLVVLNMELMADIDIEAMWARRRPSLATRIVLLGHLADLLDLNGGQIAPRGVRAPFQRIGWRHDEGAWLRAVVLP